MRRAEAFVWSSARVFAIAVGSALPGLSGTRATGIVVLALGVAASASAVVPSVDQLIHGNKLYQTVTALIGVVAIIGGAQMLVAASETGLAAQR